MKTIDEQKEDLDKVEQLRQQRRELRNGDRGTGETGQDTFRHGERAIGAPGYRVSNDGRSDESIEANVRNLAAIDRKFGNNQRGVTQIPGRVGRATGRPGESDSSPSDLAETGDSGTRESGNLITDDPIPPRIEEPDFTFEEGEVSLAKQQPPAKHKEDYYPSTNKGEKVFRLKQNRKEFISEEDYGKLLSRTQTQRPVEEAGAKQPGFGEKYFKREASKLSQKEVVELFEPLKQALQDDFGYLDEGIWLYCMSEDRQPIWGNIDDDEVSVLARLMLKQGQKNAEVAASVRILVDSDIYIQVAAIVAPRAIRTYQMLKGSPRPRLRQMQREARIAAGKGGRPV